MLINIKIDHSIFFFTFHTQCLRYKSNINKGQINTNSFKLFISFISVQCATFIYFKNRQIDLRQNEIVLIRIVDRWFTNEKPIILPIVYSL